MIYSFRDKITVIARRPAKKRDNLLVFKGLLPWPAALAPLAPRRAPGQALRNVRNDSYKINLNEYKARTGPKAAIWESCLL
jgi:hypothetical protein